MNKTEILDKFDINNIRLFLENVHYTKFNLYPNINDNQVKDYLLEIVENSYKTGKIFISYDNTGIIALATLRDLDWDSHHFGYKCAILDQIFVKKSMNIATTKTALDKILIATKYYAAKNNIKFISVSINSWDTKISSALQNHNFKYILTWLDGLYTSKVKFNLKHSEHEIGIVNESELKYYKKLASTNYFRGGRFYFDTNIDSSSVNKMYSKLITSSYENNDILISCRIDGKPIGLFICKKIVTYKQFNNLKVAPLRYLVIDPKIRQKHVGHDLFAGTLNYLMDSCDVISTGFEIHNLPSMNLHTKLNFKFNYTHNVFHWWTKNIPS